jgi:hypothetical protein
VLNTALSAMYYIKILSSQVSCPLRVARISHAASLAMQLGYLQVIVQEKLRSGWPGPFVKVEGCCD